MKIKTKHNTQVLHNKKVHDSVATSYERIHSDIYNPTEQARIARVLENALSQICSSVEEPQVLDFGAGTGNLTGHLLKLGAKVVAADVSPTSLSVLTEKYTDVSRLELIELNGVDLSNLDDNSMDMVATYSVLHHVPDYLGAVREFLRVVKPGGIIYMDHEVAPHYWSEDCEDYKTYKLALQEAYGSSLSVRLTKKLMNLFSYNAWRRLVNRKLRGLNDEGDIHVTKDDHIEWPLIERILLEECELLTRHDYLVCREVDEGPILYKQYESVISDMRMLVCKKL